VKPLVAVAGRIGAPGKVSRNPVAFAGRPYLDSVMRAGAEPVVLAPQSLDHRTALALLRRFDGLVLMGGSDVDPALYGQPPHATTYGVNRENDEIEMALSRAAIELELPTLAICRGMQVANVALGGDLHQHLPDVGIDALLEHSPPGFPAPPDGVMHEIDVDRGSRLAKAVDADRLHGASYHHQAVAEVGDGFKVVGRSSDGVIEAIEHDNGWFIGVQWHPEDTAAVDQLQQRLYDAFTEQAHGG
jgi:putative glutamine amidotransferase